MGIIIVINFKQISRFYNREMERSQFFTSKGSIKYYLKNEDLFWIHSGVLVCICQFLPGGGLREETGEPVTGSWCWWSHVH